MNSAVATVAARLCVTVEAMVAGEFDGEVGVDIVVCDGANFRHMVLSDNNLSRGRFVNNVRNAVAKSHTNFAAKLTVTVPSLAGNNARGGIGPVFDCLFIASGALELVGRSIDDRVIVDELSE